jgi:hypothetical protein
MVGLACYLLFTNIGGWGGFSLRLSFYARMPETSHDPLLFGGKFFFLRSIPLSRPACRTSQLALLGCEAIAQRVGRQYHLSGKTKEETAAYIRHHLKVAGMDRLVFSESVANMVHAASQGLPRMVNLICSQALYEAETKGHEVVEEAYIGRVLADLERQRGTAG